MTRGRILTLILLLAVPVFAQPDFLSGIFVSNAASGAASVSPGTLIRIRDASALPSILPDASTLQVVFEPAGAAHPIPGGPLISVSSFELQTVLPREIPLGPVTARLLRDGANYGSATIEIRQAAPGIFTILRGDGPALAHVYRDGTMSISSLTNPAVPGQDVTLWLTGLGNALLDDISVRIAGAAVKVTYAGHTAFTGVDQINIQIATDSFLGCYVPIVVHVREFESNQATLAINATPGACAHPLGITYEDLQTLDNGGLILAGWVELRGSFQSTVPEAPAWNGSATAEFREFGAFEIFQLAEPQQPFAEYLSCRLTVGFGPAFARPRVVSTRDAGPTLTLVGPRTQQVELRNMRFSYQWQQLGGDASFFTPGAWTLYASGGADLDPFEVLFELPPPIRWTNRNELGVVRRDRDVEIRWDPVRYGPGDVMTVTLTGPTGRGLECRGYAWLGRLALPQALLRTAQPEHGQGILSLAVSPHPAARKRFALNGRTGESGPALVSYAFAEFRQVTIE